MEEASPLGLHSRSRSGCSQKGTDKFIKELYVHATQAQTLRSLAAVTPPSPPPPTPPEMLLLLALNAPRFPASLHTRRCVRVLAFTDTEHMKSITCGYESRSVLRRRLRRRGGFFSGSSDQQVLMLRARLDADFCLRLKLPPRCRAPCE